MHWSHLASPHKLCRLAMLCPGGTVTSSYAYKAFVQVSLLKHGALCVQVVPDNLRSSAYAFDKGITGLLGALAAPLVRTSYPFCFAARIA